MNAPIAYPHETSPAPGVAVALVPGVEWLCMPLPFALNHINTWLLSDGDGYAAVDTGFAQEPIQQAWKSALAQRRLTRVIVTHCHPDHRASSVTARCSREKAKCRQYDQNDPCNSDRINT